MARALKRPSYSQYGEDVALIQQAFFSGPGFYVDVGACHPVLYSNTYLLYLSGWRGILIEPNPDLTKRLKQTRRRDTVVACGVSRERSVLTYNKFQRLELNSFDESQLPNLAAQGVTPIDSVKISTMPLHCILAEHQAPASFELLNIDCEGMDAEVLQSNDWERFRPKWIIVEDHDLTHSTPSAVNDILSAQDYSIRSRLGFSYIYACNRMDGAHQTSLRRDTTLAH